MGRSPGKWLKSLLAGKKSSKSGISKKSSNEKASVISTNAALSDSSVHLPLEPEPVAGSAGGIVEDSNIQKGGVTDEVILPSIKRDEDERSATCVSIPEDTEKMRHEQAATTTQAIFRGYLARREFLRLKGIIRLQAIVRGRLVRRQAVATLYCIHGIVKLQAHARGQIVRRSSIGCEVITKRGLVQQEAEQLDNQRTNASKLAQELSKDEFTTKLLASSPTVMPLRLQYGPEESNSSLEWLVRWNVSNIWQRCAKPKALSKTKHKKAEADMAMSKHNGRKVQSRKMQNGSNHSSSGSEKKKSSRVVSSVQNPGSEIKKVKHNLKKLPSPSLEEPVQSDIDTEKKRQNHDNSSSILVTEGSMTSDEPLKGLEGTIEDSTNVETLVETVVADDTITHLDSLSLSDTHHKTITDATDNREQDTTDGNEDSFINHDKEGNESNKTNRRVSLPAKHDVDLGMQMARKVPSYMASTKSAKAKLKEQASPRFGQDVAEKNSLMRRHSLPSPMNGKLSSSPRVQRLVQASAKEGIKIDRSLSSSRDGNDKTTRAEWKR